jgi:predicted small integral membrane protein
MKTVVTILAILDIVLLLSTLICGLWISGQNLAGEELASALAFHRSIAIASVVLSLIVILWMLFAYVR